MRRSWTNAVYTLALLASVVFVGCAEKNGRARAKEFLTASMYQEAIPVLQLHIQSSPTDAEAHFLLGKALLGIGDTGPAKEEFQRAGLLNSKFAQDVGSAYLDIGSVYLSKAELRSIKYGYDLLRVAVEHNPALSDKVATSLRQKGLVLVDKEPEASGQLLNEASRLNPELAKDDAVQFAVAQITTDPNERKDRLEAFVAAFPKSSHSSRAYHDIGQCYYALADYENAKVRLQYTCDQFPESGDAQDAQKLLENIKQQEEDLRQIEIEQQEAAIERENAQVEARRQATIEQARLEAEAENARLAANLQRKERAEKDRLEAEKRKLELRAASYSDFDGGGLDGWTPNRMAIANPGHGGSDGGTASGCLVVTEDKSGTGYFIAPATYHGDWRGVSELQVDLKSSGGQYFTSGHGMVGDIAIYSGSKCVWCLLPSRPPSSWQRFVVSLSPGEKWNYQGGATNLDDVLKRVTDFRIRGEYGVGKDECGLDNVKLIWRD